jgi:hypothetical protein
MKSLFNNIGTKDTDFEIMKYVEDKDIKKICLLNRYSNQRMNSESFWIQRFFQKYGIYLKDININDYRLEMNWKTYYIQIKQYVEFMFPYFSSALALSANRYDICILLNKMRNINNVVKIEDENSIYYTRDGTQNGIKEGEEIFIINKNNIINRIYRSGKLLKETLYKNKIVKSIKVWDQKNACILLVKWNDKGDQIILEEKTETVSLVKYSETRYENGKRKTIGKYFNNKREDCWYIFDKNENLTVVQYNKGSKCSQKYFNFGEYDESLYQDNIF